ncbi:sensor domain-containing diguanylate cyclase [Sphingomonas sp. M1-B02]|uniref:sensor domain-containing diguanylate cyclase n=1 Tax=Sphingomonas sp. M1-B02 TaxID=3114300 RepID=UPI00223F232F|nr:diguanylate cyclase [Sphingomonas sp. S6-11]UZK67600.1 GGDEF domain-containing protein [Sphingomonas sp. S6-11]
MAPAAAQTGVAGAPLDICVLRDTGTMRAVDLIAHPERFDCSTPQHKLGSGDFWAISENIGERSSEEAPLNIRFASLWQEGLTTHILYGDGGIRAISTDGRGVAPFLQLGAVVEQRLPLAEAPVVRILWKVRGAANVRGVLIGARLSAAEQSQRANLKMAALYSGFAGLCVALIMYNLALWRSLRYPFQLKYCLMVACLLGYAFSSSGALAWTFPDIANNDRLRVNYLLLAATGGTALFFAKSFFEERVFAGWLGRYTDVVAALMVAMGVMFVVTAPFSVRVADTAFTLVFVGLATVVGPTLWRAWRLRSNYLWLYAIGWGAPILTAILRTMANLHLIPWNFWLDNSTIFAMVAEALMSGLAIAYRIKLLREERDEAIANEVMARRLADTDPLTGLLNRRAFLNQAIGRPGEQILLIADLDHFKGVNDTLGHDGGDEVLRLFARLLRTNAPASALIARIGGEEFAILAHGAEPVEPEALLARLRALRMPFDVKVTASIGACRGPLTSEVEWKTLYRGADAALFDAKAAGRDRARNSARQAA